jgi:hypothetical protein
MNRPPAMPHFEERDESRKDAFPNRSLRRP